MKHIRISLIVALIIGAMAAVSSVPAQEKGTPKTEAPADRKGMTAEQRLEQRLDQMAKQLGLTEAQKPQLKTAMEAQTKATRALRGDTTMDAAAKTVKNKEIREAFNTTVKGFLTTAEQKAKFETWLTQQQSGKKGGKKGRTSTP